MAPLEETANLYEQVNDGSLASSQSRRSRAPPPAACRGRAGAPPELPLVGRADALATLVDAHAGAQPGWWRWP